MAGRGRPSVYTAEIAATICARLAEGQSLREVCRGKGMPGETTVRSWAIDDVHGFSAQYAKAREAGYQLLADELLEIADDGSNDWMQRKNADGDSEDVVNHEHIARSRLRVDTRKWMLSKVLPKIYGDKVAVTGGDGGPLQVAVQKFGASDAD